MHPNEMEIQIAKLLGWTCEQEDGYWPNKELVWRNRLGFREEEPDFTYNPKHLHFLLNAIKLHNLECEYVNRLLGLNDSAVVEITAVFDALTASLEKHCKTFIDVMNERIEK